MIKNKEILLDSDDSGKTLAEISEDKVRIVDIEYREDGTPWEVSAHTMPLEWVKRIASEA